MEIKQFKLNTGEEIVCQVIEWPEEDSYELILRNAMKIQPIMGNDGTVYYTLKSFLTGQISSDNLILLNSSQIVAEANPNDEVIDQYEKSLSAYLGEKEDEDEVSIEDVILRMVTPGNQIH